jgi:hypothetical protein
MPDGLEELNTLLGMPAREADPRQIAALERTAGACERIAGALERLALIVEQEIRK